MWPFLLGLKTLPLGQELVKEAYGTWMRSPEHRKSLTALPQDTMWQEWGTDGHMCYFGSGVSKPTSVQPVPAGKKNENGIERH